MSASFGVSLAMMYLLRRHDWHYTLNRSEDERFDHRQALTGIPAAPGIRAAWRCAACPRAAWGGAGVAQRYWPVGPVGPPG
jgi:hypothetical protein